MRYKKNSTESTLSLGDGFVTLRRSSRSDVIIARILGTEGPEHAPDRIILDRLIHEPHESSIGSWTVRGAITTELLR